MSAINLPEYVAVVVEEVLRTVQLDPSIPPAQTVHAALWPHVVKAVDTQVPIAQAQAEERIDKRAKPWQYTVRFWLLTPIGPELVGETDPDIMYGTGEIVPLIRSLAAQLHECEEQALPAGLSEAKLKGMLPQFRNNLGRQKAASLRIEYRFTDLVPPDGGAEEPSDYLCQADVHRLG